MHPRRSNQLLLAIVLFGGVAAVVAIVNSATVTPKPQMPVPPSESPSPRPVTPVLSSATLDRALIPQLTPLAVYKAPFSNDTLHIDPTIGCPRDEREWLHWSLNIFHKPFGEIPSLTQDDALRYGVTLTNEQRARLRAITQPFDEQLKKLNAELLPLLLAALHDSIQCGRFVAYGEDEGGKVEDALDAKFGRGRYIPFRTGGEPGGKRKHLLFCSNEDAPAVLAKRDEKAPLQRQRDEAVADFMASIKK
jgi:hypothetical protein